MDDSVASELRRQLSSKDDQLTETRLEALAAEEKMQTLREALVRLRTEMKARIRSVDCGIFQKVKVVRSSSTLAYNLDRGLVCLSSPYILFSLRFQGVKRENEDLRQRLMNEGGGGGGGRAEETEEGRRRRNWCPEQNHPRTAKGASPSKKRRELLAKSKWMGPNRPFQWNSFFSSE